MSSDIDRSTSFRRRDVLGGLTAAGIACGMGGCSIPLVPLETYPGRFILVPEGTELATDPEPASEYEMRALTGKNAGFYEDVSLAAYYLGHQGRVPARLYISPTERLLALWQHKANISPKLGEDVLLLGNMLMREYQTLRNVGRLVRPSFREYAGMLNDIVIEMIGALNRKEERAKLAALYGLSPRNVQMVLHLLSLIDARVLIPYSMNEIMPYGGSASSDNILVYDFILQNWGIDFLNRVASLAPNMLDIGSFQFTRFALARGVGAGKVNRVLPKELQIPERIELLVSLRDHAAAAILFALHNLASFVTTREIELSQRTFTQIMALYHHRPVTAGHALQYLSGEDVPGTLRSLTTTKLQYETPATLEDGARYAEKAGGNYDAVQKYLAWPD